MATADQRAKRMSQVRKTGIRKQGVGYRVKQYGATCGECHRKMGHGTEGIVVMHGHSFFYYHPSCFKRREKNQYPGHMI